MDAKLRAVVRWLGCVVGSHRFAVLSESPRRVAARGHLHPVAGALGVCVDCGAVWHDLSGDLADVVPVERERVVRAWAPRWALVYVAALLALAASCGPAAPVDPRVRTVAYVDAWSSADIARLSDELPHLAALATWRVVDDPATADAVVHHHEARADCSDGAFYVPGTRDIYLDPVCLPDLELPAAEGHELGHLEGLGHVCRVGEDRADCSPVGRGVAMMNPRLLYGQEEIDFDHVYEGEVPSTDPTELDVAEARRVLGR